MLYWQFKVYYPEDEKGQPQAWYEQQLNAVKGQFDSVLDRLVRDRDFVDAWAGLLPGYAELQEIKIEIDLPKRVMHLALIGFWKPDSNIFIVLLCCEKDEDYNPPLYKALEYKRAWENDQGAIHDFIIDEYEEFL